MLSGISIEVVDGDPRPITREFVELVVIGVLRQNHCIGQCDATTSLSIHRPGDKIRSAGCPTLGDHLVDERHDVVWESNRELLGHTRIIPG